ncbi:MAG: hypothetical protein JXR81_05850 [Candidatus Goldbacteria bacterium]|nr:hypothetical protein [Candidatus Goldiibacteriota bacterium]
MNKIKVKGISRRESGGAIREISDIPREVTDKDAEYLRKVIFCGISPEKEKELILPELVDTKETAVLAVHWHPEFVPVDLALRRVKASFPNAADSLIIPTQHNEILELEGFSGVEVDCFSPEFNRKVQLLLHFKGFKSEKAAKLVSMISHTFLYRSSQMYEFLNALNGMSPAEKKIKKTAAEATGVPAELVEFTVIYAKKFAALFRQNEKFILPGIIKNKLIRNFFDELRNVYDARVIDMCQLFLKAVKEEVKKGFSHDYFFNTHEVIEEARVAGAGIVVPHPEQFWPILLADYDIDGFEVWNPQSREFTEFLINVTANNKSKRRKLVFMGDDTHLGEKVRPKELQEAEKSKREIGFQPAWKEPEIQNALKKCGFSKEKTIKEYKNRL